MKKKQKNQPPSPKPAASAPPALPSPARAHIPAPPGQAVLAVEQARRLWSLVLLDAVADVVAQEWISKGTGGWWRPGWLRHRRLLVRETSGCCRRGLGLLLLLFAHVL